MAMTDTRTNYMSNAFLCVGKEWYGTTLNGSEKQLRKPTQSVPRLKEPIRAVIGTLQQINLFLHYSL